MHCTTRNLKLLEYLTAPNSSLPLFLRLNLTLLPVDALIYQLSLEKIVRQRFYDSNVIVS